MKFNIYIILAWVFLLFISYFGVHAQDTPPVDLYCGDQNCYEGKKYNINLARSRPVNKNFDLTNYIAFLIYSIGRDKRFSAVRYI